MRTTLMMAVTAVNECRYCSYYHVRESLRVGLSADEISELTAGEFSGATLLELFLQEFLKGLEEAGHEYELGDDGRVKDIRGRGLMIGIELDRPCAELVQQALQQGVLINVTAGNTVRLLPPMIMTDELAAELGSGVGQLINDFHTP